MKNLSQSQFDSYKQEVIKELISLGAEKEDLDLLKDEIITNGIRNQWSPKTVAWAIMQ